MLVFPQQGQVFSACLASPCSKMEVAEAVWSAVTEGQLRPLLSLVSAIKPCTAPFLSEDWTITRPDRLGFVPSPCKTLHLSASARPSKAELLGRGDLRAALLWGEHHPDSGLPPNFRPWGFWVGLAAQGHWPRILLYLMAKENLRHHLSPPQQGIAPYAAILAGWVAAIWDARMAIATWESLNMAMDVFQARLRWKLLFLNPQHAVVPPTQTSSLMLERLSKLLPAAHASAFASWTCLLELDAEDDDLWDEVGDLWRQSLPPEMVEPATWLLDSGVSWCAACRPDLLGAYLALRNRWEKLWDQLRIRPGTLAEWLIDGREPMPVLLLLVALWQSEQATEAAPQWVLELAQNQEKQGGHYFLEAYSQWRMSLPAPREVSHTASQLGLDVVKLHSIQHWRRLNGEGTSWPKAIRRLQEPSKKWSEKAKLKAQLKTEQGLEQTYRDSGLQAWKKLMGQVVCQLAGQVLQMPTWWASDHPELWPALWTLNDRDTKPELVRAIFEPRPLTWSTPNRDWLAQLNPLVNQDQWLKGVEEVWLDQGQRYRWSSATLGETLRMGSEFGTCLDTFSGSFASMAVTHALDVNKQVLWLRNSKGQPVARQLVGLTSSGKMTPYPIYFKDRSFEDSRPEFRQHWRLRLRAFSERCQAPIGKEEQELPSLHPHHSSYLDCPELEPFSSPEPLEADHFSKLLQGQDVAVWYLKIRALEVGAVKWLDQSPSSQNIPQCYWERLHYRTAWRQSLQTSLSQIRPNLVPAALVGFPLEKLLAMVPTLFPESRMRLDHSSLRFVTLLAIRCFLEPGNQLWPLLRPGNPFCHLAWLLADISPQGPQRYRQHLRRSNRRLRSMEQPRLEARLATGSQSPMGWVSWWHRQYPWNEYYALLASLLRQNLPERQRKRAQRLSDRRLGNEGFGTKGYRYSYSLVMDLGPEQNDIQCDHVWAITRKGWHTLMRGLSGDSESLFHWMFRIGNSKGDQSEEGEWQWRCQLITRLWFDGHLPHVNPEELLAWVDLAAPDSWACWDLRTLLGRPAHPQISQICSQKLLLGMHFPHLRDSALEAIRAMSPADRDHLLLCASTLSAPLDWEQLSHCRPEGEPWKSDLKSRLYRYLQEGGARAQRLRDWLGPSLE